jgi:Lyzozyme M1 (1,4-beta-N-acetylmuramidase)
MKRFMKEQFDKYIEYLPFVILMAFIVWRPMFDFATPSGEHVSATKQSLKEQPLAAQYIKHGGDSSHKVHGIDVSYDQGVIDWTKVLETDVAFVYLKATDGMTYTDPMFHRHMTALAKQDTLLYGAYHFFEAEDDPEKQAENYLRQVSEYSPHLLPMVDVEVTEHQDPEEIKKRLKVFSDKVEAATGCLPMIYSYRSFWDLDIGPSFDHHVFWLADYAKKMDAPKNVKNLTLWQYSDRGSVKGITGPVDLDVVTRGDNGLDDIRCAK